MRSGVSSLAGEVKKNAEELPDPVAGAVRAAADAVQSATTDEPQVGQRSTGLDHPPRRPGGLTAGAGSVAGRAGRLADRYQAAVRPAPVIVRIASPASSLAARSTSAVIE